MEVNEQQLERDKFTFEKARSFGDLAYQTAGMLYKQLFAFNIGALTLIFFVINKAVEYEVNKWFYALIGLSIICSTILITVYRKTMTNFSVQQDAVFVPPSDDIMTEYEKCQKNSNKKANYSYYFCLGSWVCVLCIIFIGIFTIDFSKENDIHKKTIVHSHMPNTTTPATNTTVRVETKNFEPTPAIQPQNNNNQSNTQ